MKKRINYENRFLAHMLDENYAKAERSLKECITQKIQKRYAVALKNIKESQK